MTQHAVESSHQNPTGNGYTTDDELQRLVGPLIAAAGGKRDG